MRQRLWVLLPAWLVHRDHKCSKKCFLGTSLIYHHCLLSNLLTRLEYPPLKKPQGMGKIIDLSPVGRLRRKPWPLHSFVTSYKSSLRLGWSLKGCEGNLKMTVSLLFKWHFGWTYLHLWLRSVRGDSSSLLLHTGTYRSKKVPKREICHGGKQKKWDRKIWVGVRGPREENGAWLAVLSPLRPGCHFWPLHFIYFLIKISLFFFLLILLV